MSHKAFDSLQFQESEFLPHDSLNHADSPVYAFYGGKLVTKSSGGTCFVMRELFGFASSDTLFIGTFEGIAHYAVELETLPPENTLVSLRHYLDDVSGIFGRLGKALQLLSWDKNHRYCGVCGASTRRGNTEWVRHCPSCGHRSYPRISPCVIMSIRWGTKILLAQRPQGLTNFHTVLAGFVEPGESAEQAVAREVWEEAGIHIADIRYFDSQPWPFPGQLMLGFQANYASGELNPDENELMNAGWYDYRELPQYPSTNTISGQLIEKTIRDIESEQRT